jgi:hypothetical protein
MGFYMAYNWRIIFHSSNTEQDQDSSHNGDVINT